MRNSILSLVLLALSVPACDLDVPDLSNPGLDDLEEDPTRTKVTAATTGLLIRSRGNYAAANGFVAQLGIIGREAYNFDGADPRFRSELLEADLNAGSPFGGNFWALPYSTIRAAHIVLAAASNVPEFSAEEIAGMNGFAKTLWALELLEVIQAHDSNGVVIDTDRPIGDVGAIASKEQGLDFAADLLDEAATDLNGAGAAFSFPLSSGFAGFDTPETFRTVNRGLRARIAAYQADHQGILDALADSFINDAVETAGLEVGAYYSYSTSIGDQVNNLINTNIFVHPSVTADAEADDARVARKVTTTDAPGSSGGRTSDQKFTSYTGPTAPVAIIRNEELILLRAEANLGLDQLTEAAVDLNLIRTVSAKLATRADLTTAEAIEDELLASRRYSLLFEGGHRWIDLRRFDRLEELVLDFETDQRNVRYPIPLPECNARPNEPACALGSL